MDNKNPKPIDRDDPRLTAYALGEVTPDERAEIEAALASDASLAAEVESIRQTTELLQTTLAAEPLPDEPVKVRPKKKWYARRLPQLGVLAASACLLLAVLIPALQPARQYSRNIAALHTAGESAATASASDKSSAADQEPLDGQKLKYSTTDLGRRKDVKKGKANNNIVGGTSEVTHHRTGQTSTTSTPWGYSQNSKWPKSAGKPLSTSAPMDRREGISQKAGYGSGGAAGKPSEVQMMITPRVITQEQEEERIGLSTAEGKPPTAPVSSGGASQFSGSEQVFGREAKDDQSAPRTKNRVILDRLSFSSGDIVNIKKIRESERRLQASEVFKEGSQNTPKIIIRPESHNTEAYDRIVENEFLRTSEQPLSTFSIDVDTAGYSNLRRFLNSGSLPPKGSIRTEELVNYFDYDYSPPTAEEKTPFAAHLAVAACPWNEKHELVRIALKGRVVAEESRPEMNLVFLLDVSGSMSSQNKLPLVKEGMTRLVKQLDKKDRVAIVVYAGASGLVLPSTVADEEGKPKILAALDRLNSGGSTNGGDGIRLAYATAAKHFNRDGVNRVILCTDGDFNVGTTSQSELVSLIEKKAKEDVFLTVLGFGCGNYKDSTLEKLADKGNGNYGYIDTLAEAEKLLVRQRSGTLVTIAKDVKIQVEFNPANVAAYRLLGYENRVMAKEDFNDDTKDAGEIGAGHTVTAFYELVPVGADTPIDRPAVDPLKYQADSDAAADKTVKKEEAKKVARATDTELLTLKLRYKEPDGDTSTKVEFPLVAPKKLPAFAEADSDFRFAGSVVGLAMLLRDSKYKGTVNFEELIDWAEGAGGSDPHGYRNEFIQLLRAARSMSNE